MATVKIKNNKIVIKNSKVSCACCATPFGLLASATSAGGGQGCQMGPAIERYHITPPYFLRKNNEYILRINFNSGDGLFHVNSYYEANFSFTPDIDISWTTTHGGNTSDPWSVSNNGKTIRYSLEDSQNCGGSNSNTQTGTAQSILTGLTEDITFDFNFNGIAELQAIGFENIQFYLDPV